jgi:nucleotide-binding universal stress UspA family protein
MEPIKKILVALDMSEMDDTLVRFASFVTKSSPANEIYFINVIRSLNVPEEVEKEFPDMVPHALDERKKIIQEKIDRLFHAYKEMKTQIIVEQGQPSKAILRFVKSEAIDIIIIGNKKTLPGSGVIAQRLARRAGCKLLIIPEKYEPSMDRILVPIDFSEYSKLALEYAIYISRNNEGKVEIICQNVYNVPVGYHYTGKSYDEFAEVMKRNAERNFNKFIGEIDTEGVKITPVYSLDINDDFTTDICDIAREKNVSGIIIGAKGRSSTTALFIGSMAEKLMQVVKDYPLTVVRPKGKTAGIMEALLEI